MLLPTLSMLLPHRNRKLLRASDIYRVGKSRFTAVGEAEFIPVLLYINYCILCETVYSCVVVYYYILYHINCKLTFAPPCVCVYVYTHTHTYTCFNLYYYCLAK